LADISILSRAVACQPIFHFPLSYATLLISLSGHCSWRYPDYSNAIFNIMLINLEHKEF